MEWISVKDRLPEENLYVLAWVKENNSESGADYINIDVYHDECWENIADFEDHAASVALPPGSTVSRPEVTHWMPLPAAPDILSADKALDGDSPSGDDPKMKEDR